MTIEEFIGTPSFWSTLIGSCITAAVSLQVYFLKAIGTRFDNLGDAIKEQGHQMYTWLAEHEEKDSRRHEENLAKFEKINITLAKAGHHD